MLYTHNQTCLYGRGYVYREVKPLKNKYSFQNIYYYDYHRPLVVWLSFVLSILSVLSLGLMVEFTVAACCILQMSLAITSFILIFYARKNYPGKDVFRIATSIINIVGIILSLLLTFLWTIHITNLHKKSDIYNANFIGYKIDEYIKNTEYEDDLKQYYNKVYSLQDTTYQELPEDISSHIDYLLELQYVHSGELYTTIEYKMNGATGYAFLIDETNKVHIYISNENKLDEWEIYPETCEEYEFD